MKMHKLEVTALIVPLARLRNVPDEGRALSAALASLSFLWSETFLIGCGVLALLNAWDYILGARLAHVEGRFSGAIAFNRGISKLTAFVLIFVFRILEWWLAAALLIPFDTRGLVASAATFGFIIIEIHSIRDNRRALGGGDGDVVDVVLAFWARAIEPRGKASP